MPFPGRRERPLPRCAEEHANGRPRAKKARIPVSHELRQDTTRTRHSRREYIRQGHR